MRFFKIMLKQIFCLHWFKRTGDPKWFIKVSRDSGYYKAWKCKRCGFE